MKEHGRSAGFTLVELLVAVAITVAIAGVLLMATRSTLAVWRTAQDRLTLDAQAARALDALQRDLHGAVLRRDGNTWLACDVFDADLAAHGWTTAPLMKPTGVVWPNAAEEDAIGQARFSRSGVWLRMVTSAAEGPAAVSYQIVRRPSAPNPSTVAEGRYAFYRMARSGRSMLEDGASLEAHDAELMRPSVTHVLATNVVDFGVWLYGRDAHGDRQRLFPENETDLHYRTSRDAPYPESADIVLRLLNEEGATLLRALESGRVAVPTEYAGREDAWWWSVVEAHSRVYVRRVTIRGQSW